MYPGSPEEVYQAISFVFLCAPFVISRKKKEVHDAIRVPGKISVLMIKC